MTRRERLERRADRLREWADKRAARSTAAFEKARNAVAGIPFGQPILVGHHSERHHRAALDRCDRAMAAGVEHEHKAADMSGRAASIEGALERAIYSDDVDACEQLEARIAGLEAERDRIKTVNKLIRSKGFEAAAPELTDAERAELLKLAALTPYHDPLHKGFPPYHLQNLSGNLARQRKRLQFLKGEATGDPRLDVPTGATATARAGLEVVASMTTPSRPGKQPRPVWNVRGNIGTTANRALFDRMGGSFYRGVFSFWDDPTEDLEAALLKREAAAQGGGDV